MASASKMLKHSPHRTRVSAVESNSRDTSKTVWQFEHAVCGLPLGLAVMPADLDADLAPELFSVRDAAGLTAECRLLSDTLLWLGLPIGFLASNCRH